MSTSTLDLPPSNLEKALEAMAASYDRAVQAFEQDTRNAFADAYAGKPSSVDYVQRQPACIRSQPTREAFYEELDYLEPQQALWLMLAESKCPLVAALKKAVEDSYIARWSAEIGEFRA